MEFPDYEINISIEKEKVSVLIPEYCIDFHFTTYEEAFDYIRILGQIYKEYNGDRIDLHQKYYNYTNLYNATFFVKASNYQMKDYHNQQNFLKEFCSHVTNKSLTDFLNPDLKINFSDWLIK